MNEIVTQIETGNIDDFHDVLKSLKYKNYKETPHTNYVHIWSDNRFSIGNYCMKKNYPSLKEIDVNLYLSPLYRTLNGD
jgi:hypothetical protein